MASKLPGRHVRIDPHNFFECFVLPTVDDFRREPLNERRAFLAAIMVHHMADYVAAHEGVKLSELAARLGDGPELSVLRDVADAAKHSVLRSDTRALKDSGQIERLYSRGLFQAPFGQGAFAEANSVCVHGADGATTQLLPVLDAAITAWKTYLGRPSNNNANPCVAL